MDQSHIADIVDASAAVARTITGVSWAFGVGNGTVLDPYTGQPVRPPQGNLPEPFTHVSEFPTVAPILHKSANVTELRWTVQMYLYTSIADYPTIIRTLAPFCERYLGMFSQNMQLLGTCNSAEIQSFAYGGGPDENRPAYLRITLQVYERIDLDNRPGDNLYGYV